MSLLLGGAHLFAPSDTMATVIAALESIQLYLSVALQFALIAWALWGVVHCALQRADSFVMEGKLSKIAWLAICGVSAVAFWWFPFNLPGFIAMVAVGVYFADVKPAVSQAR